MIVSVNVYSQRAKTQIYLCPSRVTTGGAEPYANMTGKAGPLREGQKNRCTVQIHKGPHSI